ncbi:response regulator [Streptomyces monticola]|uniref:Response regulator n=1 Tax=Streptomyces monticola TaxID=2666263 RepID=A0ABW2JTY9_9ACTN
MIRVVLADDEEIIRDGLRTVLESAGDIEVVGVANNGTEALTAVRQLVPDVLVLDLNMPVMGGITALRHLEGVHPRPRVLILTTFGDEGSLLKAWECGADGFMLKMSSSADLLHAVRNVAAQGNALAPALIKQLLDRMVAGNDSEAELFKQRLHLLSAQERRTVLGVAKGRSNREIGRELGVAEGTVKAYVSRALQKLELSNRTHMAVLANKVLAAVEQAGGEQAGGVQAGAERARARRTVL